MLKFNFIHTVYLQKITGNPKVTRAAANVGPRSQHLRRAGVTVVARTVGTATVMGTGTGTEMARARATRTVQAMTRAMVLIGARAAGARVARAATEAKVAISCLGPLEAAWTVPLVQSQMTPRSPAVRTLLVELNGRQCRCMQYHHCSVTVAVVARLGLSAL